MTLDKFDYVLAVAEERNLRKAAARLYISQPGLTIYLNKLEQYLGVKLFNRNVNPIQITEAGALYIAKMKELKKNETVLRTTLKDMGTPGRVLRVGMGMTRGMQWLPILLPAFKALHPDVSVHIQDGGLNDLEYGIIDGSIDVAFGAMNSSFPEITYENLRKEYIYCVIPRSSPVGKQFLPSEATIYHPARITGEQLKDMTFLHPAPTNGFYSFTDSILNQHDIYPRNTITLSNLDTAYQLAANGCGTLIINAFDYHRTYPQLDVKLAFCVLDQPTTYRLSKMAYKNDCPNIDLIQDLKEIIYTKLLPFLNEASPVYD